MFEALEKTGQVESLKRFAAFLISTAVHILAIFIFVLIPLVFFNVLPESELLTFLVTPPPPPAPLPPPPPTPESLHKRAVAAPSKVSFELPPSQIPRGVPPPVEEPPVVGLLGLQSAVGTGIQVGPLAAGAGGNSAALGAYALPPPPPLPPPPKPKAHKPIPGGNVLESKLIRRVDPVYPEIARSARVSGIVVLQVVVDEEGNVSEVKVLQGHPLLVDAAVQAVRQWKYSPTLLNGEPVPVTASVTVIFNLVRQ